MGKFLTLATVATATLMLASCNKPAAEPAANAMDAPATMNGATDSNAMMPADSNAMAPVAGNMTDNAMDANASGTDPHGASSGH